MRRFGSPAPSAPLPHSPNSLTSQPRAMRPRRSASASATAEQPLVARDVRPRRVQGLQRHLRARDRRRAAETARRQARRRPWRAGARATGWAATSSACWRRWLPHEAPETVDCAAQALSDRGHGFSVQASCGWVLLPDERAGDPSSALRIADRRMYAQKNLGRASAGRQTVDVLLKVLSERSAELGAHLHDVTGLCRAVAERLRAERRGRRPAAAGRVAARHRQGGDPRLDTRQAGPAERGGVELHAHAHA